MVADAGDRIESLDSLRGMAALSVVFHHCLLALPLAWSVYDHGAFLKAFDAARPDHLVMWALAYTPLHLLWGGSEAVILFFVLSGLVLALPFRDGRAGTYAQFAVRRVCRIWLPYMAAIALAAVLLTLLSRFRLAGASAWFHQAWQQPLTAPMLLDHVLMLGQPALNVIDPVVWSLVHELRLSLVFPAIAWLALRGPWWLTLVVAFGAYHAALYLMIAGLPSNLALTVHYAAFFFLGALLARHLAAATAWLRARGPATRGALLVAALALYANHWLLPGLAAACGSVYLFPMGELVTGVGGALLIAVTLGSGRPRALLERPAPRWLGRVSYSLYLVHVPVLYALAYALVPALPLWAAVAIAPAASLAAAAALHRAVEVPAMALGRRLAARLGAPAAPPAAPARQIPPAA